MAIPKVSIEYQDVIFSPFTGQPAEGDEGPNEAEPSLLFAYYGDAGDFGYVSKRVRSLVSEETFETTDPEDLLGRLDIPGALAIQVDAGWNGVNTYAFAPHQEQA